MNHKESSAHLALLKIFGDRGSIAGANFLRLIESTLEDIHREMETATGEDLTRRQGACQLLRQWLRDMERASATRKKQSLRTIKGTQ